MREEDPSNIQHGWADTEDEFGPLWDCSEDESPHRLRHDLAEVWQDSTGKALIIYVGLVALVLLILGIFDPSALKS